MYLKYFYFILSILQSINIFTDISIETYWYKYYNETLFGVFTMHIS